MSWKSPGNLLGWICRQPEYKLLTDLGSESVVVGCMSGKRGGWKQMLAITCTVVALCCWHAAGWLAGWAMIRYNLCAEPWLCWTWWVANGVNWVHVAGDELPNSPADLFMLHSVGTAQLCQASASTSQAGIVLQSQSSSQCCMVDRGPSFWHKTTVAEIHVGFCPQQLE